MQLQSFYESINDTIKFSKDFNQELTYELRTILSNYNIIFFGDNFNSIIYDCPNTITNITFGLYFNKTIDFIQSQNRFKQSITHLVLGKFFNQPINYLPKTLIYLEFGKSFNHKLDCLPNGLAHLYLSNDFNHPIDNLPNTIIHLIIKNAFTQPIDNLPESLRYLSIFGAKDINVNNLPRNLQFITLGSGFNQSIDNLPDSLNTLTILNSEYSGSLDIYKPDAYGVQIKKLKKLVIGYKFNSLEKYDEFTSQFPNIIVKFI